MATPITWEDANFIWNSSSYTWDEVQLIQRAAGAAPTPDTPLDDWNKWEQKDKNKLIKLILKVYGDTITESKQKHIKQYKIKAKDIKIALKEEFGLEMIDEDVSF